MRLGLSLVLTIVLSLSLVASVGTQPRPMDPAADPRVAELEVAFMTGMIGHHRDAIAMAQMAVIKSPRSELRALAQKIIEDQQAEIDKLTAFLRAWYGQEPPTESGVPAEVMARFDMPIMQGMMPDMTTRMMGLEAKTGADFDIEFMSALADHHGTAIMMAAPMLISGHHEELYTVAENVVISQGEEIRQMDQWLDMWYAVKRPL